MNSVLSFFAVWLLFGIVGTALEVWSILTARERHPAWHILTILRPSHVLTALTIITALGPIQLGLIVTNRFKRTTSDE